MFSIKVPCGSSIKCEPLGSFAQIIPTRFDDFLVIELTTIQSRDVFSFR